MTFLPHERSFQDYKTYCKVFEPLDSPYIIPEKATAQICPPFLAEKIIDLATTHLGWASAPRDH